METITGLELDEQLAVHALDSAAWRKRRDRLSQLGGPPTAATGHLLDPILFGPDPTVRARAWIERKRWAEAEAAFAEAVRYRPTYATIWAERGRYYLRRLEPAKAVTDFIQALVLLLQGSGHLDSGLLFALASMDTNIDHAIDLVPGHTPELSAELLSIRAVHHAKRGQWDRAVVDFQQAGRLAPIDVWTSFHRILALLAGGDRDGLRKVASDLLDRFGETTDPSLAKCVAWACSLAPSAAGDYPRLVGLAEIAVKGLPATQKHDALNTLGAALYRAGRFEDSIRWLGEGIRLRNGRSLPQAWAFLAMAHHRVGHRDEARRWLNRLHDHLTSNDPNEFWDELAIRLLRSEAEAVILYDPVFPADPFAH
jgi:tetratricopeptide (TPR) repeat protein